MHLKKDVISLSFADKKDTLDNYCHKDYFYNLPNKHLQRFIGIDVGLTSDLFGFLFSIL